MSFKEFKLAQQLLDRIFWTRLQGQAGGDVLWLLDPKLVGHTSLCERLWQAGEGSLIWSLETQTNFNKAVLKKEKEESTFLKFGSTNRGLGTVLTHLVVVHGICRSLSTIEVPDLFQLFCKALLFLQMFMFLNSQWKQSRDTRPWRCAIISGTRQVSSSCF